MQTWALGANMNHALKDRLLPFQSEESLRCAIDSVCAKYGKVKTLQIVPDDRVAHRRAGQCLCLLHLDPPTALAALRSELGGCIFVEGLAFFVEVAENWTGPST